MAKSKEPKAAPKKAKDSSTKKAKSDKPAKTAKPKASNLSEEKVVDSDSDGEEAPAPKVKSTPKEKAPPSSSQASKVEKEESSSEEESSEEGSSDDEESEQEQPEQKQKPQAAPQKPETVPAKVNGVKRKADESKSEEKEESSSEEEESEKEQPPPKKAKKAPTPVSSSEEEQKSSSEEEDEESSEADADTAKAPGTKSATTSIPAPPYEPPKGYRSLDTSKPSSSSPFASSNLSGKQIWHITAPSNVPLKDITDVALSSIQNAEPVLRHKGLDYVLARNQNRDAAFDRVLLPGSAGYTQTDQNVDEHFIIQQKLELPDFLKIHGTGGKGSKAAADVATPSVSTVRPQPKGLKMRYKPPGFGKGDPGRIGSGSASEEETPGAKGKEFQFPKALGMHGASDKPDSQPSDKKEKKKKKKRQSEDVVMVDADENAVNGAASMPPPSSTTPRKKDKKKKEKDETPERPGTASSHRSSESVASAEKESKEEKAKRKEAKKLKKKAKANGV